MSRGWGKCSFQEVHRGLDFGGDATIDYAEAAFDRAIAWAEFGISAEKDLGVAFAEGFFVTEDEIEIVGGELDLDLFSAGSEFVEEIVGDAEDGVAIDDRGGEDAFEGFGEEFWQKGVNLFEE